MTTPPTDAGKLGGRARGMLLVLCGALFLDALDVSMKGVALPSIRADLGMPTSSLQWVVSGYVLGFGGFLLLGGRAADLLGRRRAFIVSLGVFLVASGLGGLATNGELLIAARFVTGVSAAFTAPAGLSIITTSYPEGPARNRALSIYAATGASGFSLGLVAGGLLTELSWRWVFVVPVFMALATIAGAIALIPASAPTARPRERRLPRGLRPAGDGHTGREHGTYHHTRGGRPADRLRRVAEQHHRRGLPDRRGLGQECLRPGRRQAGIKKRPARRCVGTARKMGQTWGRSACHDLPHGSA